MNRDDYGTVRKNYEFSYDDFYFCYPYLEFMIIISHMDLCLFIVGYKLTFIVSI